MGQKHFYNGKPIRQVCDETGLKYASIIHQSNRLKIPPEDIIADLLKEKAERKGEVWAYLRVSSDRQDVDSQRIGVERKAEELGVEIDHWVEDEGVCGATPVDKRKLGKLLDKLNANDILIVSEISRLSRDFFTSIEILKILNQKHAVLYAVKEGYVLNKEFSATLLFVISALMAEQERKLIIARSIEGIERARAAGITIGRKKGTTFRKLADNKEIIIMGLRAGMTKAEIARKFNCDWQTVHRFITELNLMEKEQQ